MRWDEMISSNNCNEYMLYIWWILLDEEIDGLNLGVHFLFHICWWVSTVSTYCTKAIRISLNMGLKYTYKKIYCRTQCVRENSSLSSDNYIITVVYWEMLLQWLFWCQKWDRKMGQIQTQGIYSALFSRIHCVYTNMFILLPQKTLEDSENMHCV